MTQQTWKPIKGDQLSSLLLQVENTASRSVIERESIRILERCSPPHLPSGKTTGLVVGYVQSGKTMSFTAVSALAHDNMYSLVIVITGTSLPLLGQSNDRLIRDLSLRAPGGPWKFYTTAALRPKQDRQSIQIALDRWRDVGTPLRDRQTVFVTVLKSGPQLEKLTKLLRSINLKGISAIVIDDEADQASLNTGAKKGTISAIYSKILELRNLLPNHSFLQYTATPQAPLLISLIDSLSPDFAQVLEPGEEYVGGKLFFDPDSQLVRVIPEEDVPDGKNDLRYPPESLLDAMRIFFLGVAASLATRSGPRNRSMMVHPAKSKALHAKFVVWVDAIIQRWKETLRRGAKDRDRIDLIQEFKRAYQDLKETVSDLPPFEQLEERLATALHETIVHEVNTRQGPTPEVQWGRDPYHVLVGAQALERGFTLEGLTVTYMPRGTGVGNADTVQQRSRWLGYKAGYLGYCRVFLASSTIEALRSYVQHEERFRKDLQEHTDAGRPLQDWRRAFILHPRLRPTRNNVLSYDYVRGAYSSSWFWPKWPHYSHEVASRNRELIEDFCSLLAFSVNSRWSQHLSISGVRLKEVHERLLSRFVHAHPDDSGRFTGLLLQISSMLDSDDAMTCALFRMNAGQPRRRTVKDEGKIETIPQGPSSGGKTDRYPGDLDFRNPQEVSIQLHRLEVWDGQLIGQDVPAIGVWMPGSSVQPWLVQPYPSGG